MPLLQHRLWNVLPAEAFDLFVVFGRFEYAMKQGGYRRENSADAAWWAFADAIPAEFFGTMAADANAQILFHRPPKERAIKEDGVGWTDPLPTPTSNRQLIDCVKAVRNNLLHGDKHIGSQRDTELITASLHVLNSIFETVQNLAAFEKFAECVQHDLD